MSAFIGPIHYWLYRKIQVVNQREAYIYQKAAEAYDSVAEELRELACQTYGFPLPDKDLSELIDHSNIHGWLQRQINLAETREAAFIKELTAAYGDAANSLIKQAFAEHGKNVGLAARAGGKYDINSAPGIFRTLGDYFLNGMPCDQADTIISSEPNRIVWETAVCLQAPNWKRAGVNDKVMNEFYSEWVSGFVAGINASFSYTQDGARKTITRK